MIAVDAYGEFNGKYLIIGWSDENIELQKNGKMYVPTKILRIIREDVNKAISLNKDFKSGFFILEEEGPEFIKSGDEVIKLKQNNELLNKIIKQYLKNNDILKFLGIKNYTKLIFFNIDYIIKITDGYYFIIGWSFSEEGNKLYFYSSESMFYSFFPREDLKSIENIGEKYKNAGFFIILKTDKKNIELEIYDGKENVKEEFIELIPNKKFNSIKEVSEFIFNFIEIKPGFKKAFNILGDGLKKAWDNYYKTLDLRIKEKIYGEIPKNPKLSIIVPLYGRVDFVEFQNAVFSTDKDFLENVELIYVLDDPDRFYNIIDSYVDGIFNVYRVPFRLIKYNYNLGYARANNIGVKYAASDMILLLNSDVFPKEKNWVSKMLNIYKNLKKPGVLGFKLLYEDESIQHVGMEFKKYKYLDNMWINYHPKKGMPNNNKKELKEIEAVTGACMLLEKDKYLEVGGLSENYILGDFEDSDLCLKLKEKGYKIYYSSEPSFYHLERQSQNMFENKTWKQKITIFNCWQHTNRWSNLLEKVKNESVNS